MPVMVMYDGTPESAAAFGAEKGLTFPILSDPSGLVFERWNPAGDTPSTTIIATGMEVWSIDQTWYRDLLEEVIYGPDEE